MKLKLVKIVSIFMMLLLATGCGDNSSLTQESQEKTGVIVKVNNPSKYTLSAQKTSNVDLVINSMKIDVYDADSATDTDFSDNNLQITKNFTLVNNKWSVELKILEKGKDYIFMVSAFNATDTTNPIFKGATTSTISTTVQTEVKIDLEQSINQVNSISTISNISVVKDADDKIALSFIINNYYENSVTWSLFNADGTTLSTEFSTNKGTTSDKNKAVEVEYTKAVNSINTTYILKLEEQDGAISYTFAIDATATGADVLLEVNTPPIIESITVSIVDDTITLTPTLDRESSDTTYKWMLVFTDGTIDDPSSKTAVISNYNNIDRFEIKLEIENRGAKSARYYYLGKFQYSEIKLIDTSNQAVLDVLGVPKEEADALLALYKSTHGANWDDNSNWNTLTDVESWYGVTVVDEHVTRLELYMNGLSGALPSELGNLTNLISLFLSTNELIGAIPSELGNLTNVIELTLYQNKLTGAIPTELGSLTNLISLDLSVNKLTGAIPTEFGSLTNLISLDLSSNQLTRAIPTELGSLTNLLFLDLSVNKLTGAIPNELGSLTNLTSFDLSTNQLSSKIPTELGNLTNLKNLYLYSNRLSEKLPNSFSTFESLEGLYIKNNNLTKDHSEEVNDWLKDLDLLDDKSFIR